MEIIHSDLDNDLGVSWRSSGNVPSNPSATSDYILRDDSAWRYRKGFIFPAADGAGRSWIENGYDESADGEWFTGQAPFGHGDNDDNTVLADMQNAYITMFMRHEFEIELGQVPPELVLRALYDDVRFYDGIEFEFPLNYAIPAQSCVIVARNLNAFIHCYGSSHPSIGDCAPSQLSNGGERLELSYAGAPILELTYGDSAPWPTEADGAGRSLVLIDPSSLPDPSVFANWRASHDIGGTPGVFNFAV